MNYLNKLFLFFIFFLFTIVFSNETVAYIDIDFILKNSILEKNH